MDTVDLGPEFVPTFEEANCDSGAHQQFTPPEPTEAAGTAAPDPAGD